jgi:hypothetical protein
MVAIVHGDIGTGSKLMPRLYRERRTGENSQGVPIITDPGQLL